MWMMTMRIDFTLIGQDSEEMSIMDKFCIFFVKKIREELHYSIVENKLNVREKDLLDSGWINWIGEKPDSINMVKLIDYIIDNIICIKRKNNTYSILVNPRKNLPGSYTKLERIARFIDKGNEKTPPTLVFTKVFNRYRDNLKLYWDYFITEELDKPRVTELVVIT